MIPQFMIKAAVQWALDRYWGGDRAAAIIDIEAAEMVLTDKWGYSQNSGIDRLLREAAASLKEP